MCGFVGGTNPEWNYAAALTSIAHRGPDAEQLVSSPPFHVGFRRLAIIDLRDVANQPMIFDDGESWIVFNGEIYGYKTLRSELEREGQRFRTDSDTEVLLRAYLVWGNDFVEHLDGMFAIAIWDARVRKLELYRDRPGIKPLYYFFDGRHFAFASELKALTAICPGLEIDETALFDFLTYRYIPAPKTPYRSIAKLPPAHRLTFEPDRMTLSEPRRYWQIEVPNDVAPREIGECAEELRAVIDAAVENQMVADVPVGFFLSGGVDSSAVVASATNFSNRLKTFSIGFDSAEHSEVSYAREVADRFGTDHHERTLTKAHAEQMLPSVAGWFDEPFADESCLPTQFVSATAREKVTVVLTGDGGDEVFGGYRTYSRFARYSRFPNWPEGVNNWISRWRDRARGRRAKKALSQIEWAFSGDIALWGKLMNALTPEEKRPYAEEFGIPADYDHYWHYREHWRDDLPLRTRLQLIDFYTYLPGDILTKVDRTSMSVSLEARVPLLDRRVIEFSFGLPESTRFADGELKGLLKRAYRGTLPDSVLDRKKKGFGTPRYYFSSAGPTELQRQLLAEFRIRYPDL
jgi:asparagine synthase (glutamine-hydrolysing)